MANGETKLTLPWKWGADPLSDFVNAAFSNCLATFVRRPDAFGLLQRVDHIYVGITENLSNPPDFLGAVLFVRSHSAFRAAVRLVVSGQVADVFPMLRSCLEYAVYALHIHKGGESRATLWLRRHEGDELGRAVRREFTHAEVMKTLKDADAELARSVEALYERTIDYGGHPNERGVTGLTTMTETPERSTVRSALLHAEGIAFEHAVRTSAQVAVGALSVFEMIFRQRFQLLDLDRQLEQLRREL